MLRERTNRTWPVGSRAESQDLTDRDRDRDRWDYEDLCYNRPVRRPERPHRATRRA
jgi:hypothetical protein